MAGRAMARGMEKVKRKIRTQPENKRIDGFSLAECAFDFFLWSFELLSGTTRYCLRGCGFFSFCIFLASWIIDCEKLAK